MSFIVPFIFVNIVHIYRVSISVRVRGRVRVSVSVRVFARLKVSITRQNIIIMVAFYIMLARPVGRFWADNDRVETLISLYHGNECL